MADFVGVAGVICIVLGYFLLQLERITYKGLTYLLLNALGASCILFSLFFSWNLSAALIEFFWIAISLFGIYKYHIKERLQRQKFAASSGQRTETEDSKAK